MKLKQIIKQHKEIVIASVVVNIGVLVTFLAIASGLVFLNQGSIFESFAGNYLLRAKNELFGTGATTPTILSEESLIVDVVERSNPAVVSIIATKQVPVLEQYFEYLSPFGELFGPESPLGFPIPQYRQKGVEERRVSSGSGFIVSPNGLVVTNKHVVADKTATYTATFSNGEKQAIDIVATDSFLDVAILRLSKLNGPLPYLSFGDSDTLRPGQRVIAIGNALGEFTNSVSVGVVSGLSRSITASGQGQTEELDQVIQTDAAINPGNSGGPLLDLRGKVIGVNVAVAVGSENIGFALPGNLVKKIVDSVIQTGTIERPHLGIRYLLIDEAVQANHNLPVAHGALVTRGGGGEPAVIPGSPAADAGLAEGDIILEIDNVAIKGRNSLSLVIQQKKVGQIVSLKILRLGKERVLKVSLSKAP